MNIHCLNLQLPLFEDPQNTCGCRADLLEYALDLASRPFAGECIEIGDETFIVKMVIHPDMDESDYELVIELEPRSVAYRTSLIDSGWTPVVFA